METTPDGELGRLAKCLDNIETMCDALLHWISRIDERLENVETRRMSDDLRQIIEEEVESQKEAKG